MSVLTQLIFKRTEMEHSLIELRGSGDAQLDFMISKTTVELEIIKKKIAGVEKATRAEKKLQKEAKHQAKGARESVKSVPKETPSNESEDEKDLDIEELFTQKKYQELRRRFIREVEDELQHELGQQKYQEQVLYRLQNEKQPFSVAVLIQKTKVKQEEIKTNIDARRQKLVDIENGVFDKEILEKLRANRETISKKEKLKVSKRKTPPKRVPYCWQYKKDGQYHVSDKDIEREYARYLQNCEKFPKNLADKLKTMPNNRGFLFRGISHYGARPCIRPEDTTILTEKINTGNGQFEILEHESTPNFYRITKKTTEFDGGRRRERKEILHEEERKRVFLPTPHLLIP